jgi:Flp pilus assembly protein CpaB
MDDPTPRQVAAPRRRLAAGHLVMLLAGLLGVALTLAVVRRADDTVGVLVADRDLLPGHVLAGDDVRVEQVHGDASLLAALVPAGRPVDEAVLAGAVTAGEPLLARSLGAPARPGAARTMSFAVARARAVGGALEAGDRIDVVAADPHGGGSWFVAGDLEVVAVAGGGGGPLAGGADDVTVTVAVDEHAALRIAGALAVHDVTLVRSTGAASLRATGAGALGDTLTGTGSSPAAAHAGAPDA